jgi:hypothetical protein
LRSDAFMRKVIDAFRRVTIMLLIVERRYVDVDIGDADCKWGDNRRSRYDHVLS